MGPTTIKQAIQQDRKLNEFWVFTPSISEANALAVVNNLNNHSIFEIQVTTAGSLILNSFDYASVTSAMIHINVTDRGGLAILLKVNVV